MGSVTARQVTGFGLVGYENNSGQDDAPVLDSPQITTSNHSSSARDPDPCYRVESI